MEAKVKGFVYSSEFDQYPYPETCPFNTLRASKVRATLDSMGLLNGDSKILVPVKPAERKDLERFHTPEYIDALKSAGEGNFSIDFLSMGLGTSDCPVFKGLYENSLWAAGATLTAVEMLINDKAFAVFNPSGGLHHAFPSKASGFCYVNDIVLGIKKLTEQGRRVLFLDIDVHHTDGVQYAFYDRSDVMTISIHESGKYLFPGTGFPEETGEGQGKGYSVNFPLPPKTYDGAYMKIFYEIVLPLIEKYDPDVIALEAGADTLSGDPLAHLNLTNNVMADIIVRLMRFNKPMLITGGGGYSIENTVRAWALVWAAMCGEDVDSSAMAGMGGVMLETTDWQGGQGLRDRVIVPEDEHKQQVDNEIAGVMEKLKSLVFNIHGI